MSTKSLNERLQEDKDNVLDRREISPLTRREIAECIHHDNPQNALAKIFNVLTGEMVDDFGLWRDVEGTVELADAVVTELDGKRLRLSVSVGDQNRAVTTSDPESSYSFREVYEDEHSVSASAEAVYEYEEDEEDGTIERVEYEIEDASVTLDAESLTVDTTETPIDESVIGPKITVEELTVGDEVESE